MKLNDTCYAVSDNLITPPVSVKILQVAPDGITYKVELPDQSVMLISWFNLFDNILDAATHNLNLIDINE